MKRIGPRYTPVAAVNTDLRRHRFGETGAEGESMIRMVTIYSGGQAGVDRGALDAALQTGNPCGGWCPKGRRAEDGPIPPRYPLRQVDGGYEDRTRKNVEESDGTLILHRGALSQGTLLTLQICRELGKPVCLVDANTSSPEEAALTAQQFIEQHGIERLNVAGPRRSHWTQSYHYALDAVRALILLLWHDDWMSAAQSPRVLSQRPGAVV
jgi:hypothetical protein